MKRFAISIIAVLILCGLCPAAGSALERIDFCASADEHDANAKRLERVLRTYNAVGASIVFIKEGRIVDVYHYGKANRAEGIPVGDDTLFRVGSVTKMVSALGVMKLWEMGEFNLDEDIGTYFGFKARNPYFPSVPITIRQIMSHTSSLADNGHYSRALNGDIVRLSSMFAGTLSSTDFSRYEPGTRYHYSNFGGGLLGSVIELFTAGTADEWLSETVYQPLNITASYFTPNMPEDTQIARIYDPKTLGVLFDSEPLTRADMAADFERHYTYTAGALSISAIDLAKVLMIIADDGIVDGRMILNPETVHAMREAQNNIGSVRCDAGRGLNLNIITNSIVQGRTLYGHQGKAYNMICAAYCDPTDRTGVVLLTNGCDDSTFNSVARIVRGTMAEAWNIIDEHR